VVTAELAARKMYDALAPVMSKATAKQKQEVAAYCQSIAKKYPDTPTGKKAAALAEEIQSAPVPS
jgi:hypothetical protein